MFLLLLPGLHGFSQNAVPSSANMIDSRIAKLYVNGALKLYRGGDSEGARELLSVALEYAPRSSDAHFLLGEIQSTVQTDTAGAISSYRAALIGDGFSLFSAGDCAISLARILTRVHDYAAALRVLSADAGGDFVTAAEFGAAPERSQQVPLPPPMSVGRVKNELLVGRRSPDFLLVLAGVFNGLGQQANAQAVISRGTELFPTDARFVELADLGSSVPALGTSRWLDEHVSNDPAYLSFVLDYVIALPDGEVRNHFLNLYFQHGGNDPLAWALSAGSVKSDSDAIDGFDKAGGKSSISAIRMIDERLSSQSERSAFESQYAHFSGVLTEDSNRDGYYERRLTYADGALTELAVDANEDGVAEEALSFGVSGLESVQISPDAPGAGYIVVKYGQYPSADSITYNRSSGRTADSASGPPAPASPVSPPSPPTQGPGSAPDLTREPQPPQAYGLPPVSDGGRGGFSGSIRYDVAGGAGVSVPVLAAGDTRRAAASGGRIGVFDQVELAASVPAVPEAVARAAASSATVMTADPGVSQTVVRRVILLERGTVYLSAIDHNADGKVDEVIEYRNGEPYAGVRDANADGYFEISELFSGGAPVYLAIDEDQNGTPEFFEELGSAPSLAWDLNGDGKIDVKEIASGRREVMQLISSKLNGVLDISRQVPGILFPTQSGRNSSQ